MERKALTPLDFLTDSVSPIHNFQNINLRAPQTTQRPQVTYQKGASPTTYGPSPTDLPLFEQSASGAILLEKWGNESPASHHQSQRRNSPKQHQFHQKYQNNGQDQTLQRQETVEQAQHRIKAEVEAARFKIAATEAQNENEQIRKLLSEEKVSSENLKIKLRNEISSHAQTVEQSRSTKTIAQQLRLKNETYENEISALKNGLSAVQNENRELREKLRMQDSRVDALGSICRGLEIQLRELVSRNEGNLPQLDVAAQWRNHAYKAMVKANHNEARLKAEINKLHQITNQLSYPPLQGPTKLRQIMPLVE